MVAEEQLPPSVKSTASTSASASASEDSARMKFLCSYGGKILPKADGQLRYVGGDTRLVSFNKNIGFADLIAKLEKLFGPNLSFKYQLPNEDLDTLISVTCDDDVMNLVEEYEKNESRDGSSRLRAFLFPRNGLPLHHVHACSCHAMDDIISPREHRYPETVTSPPIQTPEISCLGTPAFQVPDYLDAGCSSHISQYQHQEKDDQRTPRQMINDRTSVSRSVGTNLQPLPMQTDYSRQNNSKFIDSGGRGPALTTSALGPLSSSHQCYNQLHHYHVPQQQQNYQAWERRNPWDESILVNQREEKYPVDLNTEPRLDSFHRDTGIAAPMVRIPSRERIVPNVVDSTVTDGQMMFDRQARSQALSQMDLHLDIGESHLDGRQDITIQSNNRYFKPPEVHRIPAVNLQTTEMPLVPPMTEKSVDNSRHSGDSDEGKQLRSALENLIISQPVINRHDDPVSKQQPRHGGFVEIPQAQHDHLHSLGKSHFQHALWQGHEQQQQLQLHPSAHEIIRVGNNAHGVQRYGHPLDFHGVSSSAPQHTTTVNSIWTTTRPDPLPNTRVPSPLFRHVASPNPLQPDPPSPRRGQVQCNSSHPSSPRRGAIQNNTSHPPSPRPGQIPSNAGYLTTRHGLRMLPVHDMSYVPANKVQPSPNHFFPDPVELHHHYDHSGNQSPFVEKGSPANYDTSLNQSPYFDKVIVANQDGTMANNNIEAKVTSAQIVPPFL